MDNAFLYPTAAVDDFYAWNKDGRFGGAAAIAFSPAGWSTISGAITQDGAKGIKRKDFALLADVTDDVDATKKQKVLAEAEVIELKARNAQLEGMVAAMIRVTTEANRVYEQGQEVAKRVQEESNRVQEKLRRENEKLRRACEQAQEEAKRAYRQAREELKAAQAEFLNAIKAGVNGLEQA